MKQAIKYTLKVYSIVHGLPFLLFSKKRKEILEKPLETLKRILVKVLGSMCFLGGFIMVMRTSFCLSRFRGKVDFLFFFIISIFNTSGVLFEEASRGEDYAIFTFPKVFEGFWDLLKKVGLVKDIPYSMDILFAVSIALFLLMKKFYPKEMPLSYRNQLSIFFDKSEQEKQLSQEEIKIDSQK